MKQEVMEDGTVITGSDPVEAPFTVEPNRAQYRARIFGKNKIAKAPKFNRQNGRTEEQYKKAGFKGYFNDIMDEELTPTQVEALEKINEFEREQIKQAKETGGVPF